MKTAVAILTVAAVLLGGILFLASRADHSAGQPAQYQVAEIPQTGPSEPGGSQGNPPGNISNPTAPWTGLAASLAGAFVLGVSVMVFSRKKSV